MFGSGPGSLGFALGSGLYLGSCFFYFFLGGGGGGGGGGEGGVVVRSSMRSIR